MPSYTKQGLSLQNLTPIVTFLSIFIVTFFISCGGASSSDTTTPSTETKPIADTNETQPSVETNETEPSSTITPVVIENRSFTSAHFSGSSNCATCHNDIQDENAKDVSIETAWSATIMGNASKDPLWRAKVASELKRNKHLEDVIDDKCTKCHAPMANYEAHHINETPKVFENGFLNPSNKHYDEAMNGVSCSLCHQVENNAKLGTLDSFSGDYDINSQREIYGQYSTNLLTNPMIQQINYTPTYSAHISDSKMCATCHNLKTPFVDANGDINSTTSQSEFPEQMPYSEWEHSVYDSTHPKSCQECHMQKTDGVKISNRPKNGSITARDNFSEHTFVGGNRLMLDILSENKEILGIPSATNFTNILARTDAILQSAATLSLQNLGTTNNILSVHVNLTSNTGHKLPTSFPSRRVFIHFTLYDSANTILFESGKVNDDGSIIGADSDVDATTYEPHYDTISAQEQVQIYEAIMQNTDNKITYTLLRAASYVKDNRLLPLGFDKTTAVNDIAVIGEAYNNDANFIGGSDRVTYDINTSGFASTPHHIKVELNYQTLSYPFAKDLFSDDTNESNNFKTMFDASQMKTSTLTSATLNL